jgi:hypothetical protein
MFLTLIYSVIVPTNIKTIQFTLAFINLLQIVSTIELFLLSWINSKSFSHKFIAIEMNRIQKSFSAH